jgi:topoisomerase-4 subunit B
MAEVATQQYTEDNIKTLEWWEHIRRRPGMYIGKLGDGGSSDDGIYVLLKEVIDNSIDEFMMGNGKKIIVDVENTAPEGEPRHWQVSIRDYGRGIPLGSVVDVSSKMNTGGKYDSEAFQKSIGLNGVGIKAVNALSTSFVIESFRDGQCKRVEYSRGLIVKEHDVTATTEKNGTHVVFTPDDTVFEKYDYRMDVVQRMLKNYTYLNKGLTMCFNGENFKSEEGVVDLLRDNMTEEPLYPIIHLEDQDLEIALTHCNHDREEYYTFCNGQHTTQGGTHLMAFKEAVVKTIRDFLGKNYDASDIRTGMAAVVSIRVQEPVFESQTKTKLGSKNMAPDESSVTIKTYVQNFLSKYLDDYLHRNLTVGDIMSKKIQQNEEERKDIQGVKKAAREKAKKASLNNTKQRDCRIHLTDK